MIRRLVGIGRAFAQRIAPLVQRIPLSGLGALVVIAGLLAVREFGQKRQDLVLYVVGYGLVGTVLLAAIAVGLTALALGLRRRTAAADPTVREMEAEAEVDTGFSLPALGWLPLVSIRWEWSEPSRVSVEMVQRSGRLFERIAFHERGEHERIVRRITVEDSFGLARITLDAATKIAYVVRPARARPPSAPLVEALASGDYLAHPAGPPEGDLLEMRRYAPGDPINRVLWRSYARTRTLLVRLPERAASPTRRTIAFLVAGEGDEPTASVARMAIESGALGEEWRFGADGSDGSTDRIDRAVALIVKSRAARANGGRGLGPFLATEARFASSRCVIFAPARAGGWLREMEAALRGASFGVEVVLGCDGLGGGDRRSLGSRLLMWSPGGEPEPTQEELMAIARRLAAVGARVTIADRRTGRVTPALALERRA